MAPFLHAISSKPYVVTNYALNIQFVPANCGISHLHQGANE